MKVYGTNIFVEGEQVRAIVAAKNRKAAAELLRVSVSYLRNYGSETGNETEVKIATEKPETVFFQNRRRFGFNSPYTELVRKQVSANANPRP